MLEIQNAITKMEVSPTRTGGRLADKDKWESRRLAQSLAVRVVELESENRRLREEIANLTESQAALSAKNKLFEAKLLELQARLMHGQAQGQKAKFRSPLIKDEEGTLVYRFERPQSARIVPRTAQAYFDASGSQTARAAPIHKAEAFESVEAAEFRVHRPNSARRAPGTTRISLENARGAHGPLSARSHRPRPPPPLIASANPPAVQRVFREHRRMSSPRTHTEQTPITTESASKQPEEAPSLAGHARNVEGSEEVGSTEEGLELLRKDLEEGSIGSDTRLTIHVDYCTDNGTKALTVRHNPAKYREIAEQLEQAVAVTFKGWRVSTQIKAHEWTAGVSDDKDSLVVPNSSGKWCPPLGAFEVFLNWEVSGNKRSALLHSKLASRKFPDTFACLASVIRLIGLYSPLLSSS